MIDPKDMTYKDLRSYEQTLRRYITQETATGEHAEAYNLVQYYLEEFSKAQADINKKFPYGLISLHV